MVGAFQRRLSRQRQTLKGLRLKQSQKQMQRPMLRPCGSSRKAEAGNASAEKAHVRLSHNLMVVCIEYHPLFYAQASINQNLNESVSQQSQPNLATSRSATLWHPFRQISIRTYIVHRRALPTALASARAALASAMTWFSSGRQASIRIRVVAQTQERRVY